MTVAAIFMIKEIRFFFCRYGHKEGPGKGQGDVVEHFVWSIHNQFLKVVETHAVQIGFIMTGTIYLTSPFQHCSKACYNEISCKASTVISGTCRHYPDTPAMTREIGYQARICRFGVLSCPAERAPHGERVCTRHEGLRLWIYEGGSSTSFASSGEEVRVLVPKKKYICFSMSKH